MSSSVLDNCRVVEHDEERNVKILQRPNGSFVRVENDGDRETSMDANYLLIYSPDFEAQSLVSPIERIGQLAEFEDIEFKLDVEPLRVGVLFKKKTAAAASAFTYIDLMDRLKEVFEAQFGQDNVVENIYLSV